jgi:hypothetical protein
MFTVEDVLESSKQTKAVLYDVLNATLTLVEGTMTGTSSSMK